MADDSVSAENREQCGSTDQQGDAEGEAEGHRGVPTLVPASEISGMGDDARDVKGEQARGIRAKKKRRTPGVKVPRWSVEEEDKLRALVEEHGTKEWGKIAAALGSQRSAAGVDQHWQIMGGKGRPNGKASDGVSGAIVAAAALISSTDADAADGEPVLVTTIAPPNRAKRDRRNPGKVARWTTEEEEHLRTLVGDVPEPNWGVIAQELGTGRTATGVDQHYQIMMGKRKTYYQKRKAPGAPVAVATLQADAPTNSPGLCSEI
jgi:hypothetical protein